MKLIDTHFHLDKYRDHQLIYDFINTKKQYTLCVTCSPGVFLSCKRLYPETTYVKFGLGVHPSEITDPKKSIYEFDSCINQARYIGEIGLDFSKPYDNREGQMIVLRHILEVQANKNILATIHVKKAETEIISLFNEFPSSKRIVHWFTGTESQMISMLDTGCYFSVNASMICSKSGMKIVARIPKDRLLIESDGPYSKVNGKKYTPEMLEEAYQAIETALQIKDLEKITYQNFLTVLTK